MREWISNYIKAQKKSLDAIPSSHVIDIINLLKVTRDNGNQIFVFGNGGSAANASHFATDLGKGASDKCGNPFKIICLNDNQAWMTAIANDYSYEDVFWRQLEKLSNTGDVSIGLSVSGKSPNIVAAMDWSAKHGLKNVQLPSYAGHYGRTEDIHMTILHMVAYAFIEGVVK